MNAYVVIAVCNFDDVLMGVYEHDAKGREMARRRAMAVAKCPELRRKATQQANDTEFLHALVYEVTQGTKFEMIMDFEPEAKLPGLKE